MSKASSMTEIGCGPISRGRYWPYSSVDLRSFSKIPSTESRWPIGIEKHEMVRNYLPFFFFFRKEFVQAIVQSTKKIENIRGTIW